MATAMSASAQLSPSPANGAAANSDCPRIRDVAWGGMTVEHAGKTLHVRDCRLWPGGAEEWDWGTTGTRHRPGIQVADLRGMVENEAGDVIVDYVVLSTGMRGELRVGVETETYLASRRVEFCEAKTLQAVEKYGQQRENGSRVAGLFHTTC